MTTLRPRLVLFDFDGTLADSDAFVRATMDLAARRYGFRTLAEAGGDALRGRPPREIVRAFGLPAWKVPQVAAFMRRRMAAALAEAASGGGPAPIALFDGVADALRGLAAAGLELGIVTSNGEDNVRAVLGECAGLFTHRECGAALFGKARRIRRLLARAGVAPAEAVLVGDELRDAEAAVAAGISFGAVAWGYARYDALCATGPAWRFERPADLLALAR